MEMLFKVLDSLGTTEHRQKWIMICLVIKLMSLQNTLSLPQLICWNLCSSLRRTIIQSKPQWPPSTSEAPPSCILPSLKNLNVPAHCKHGPLVPHKHKTRHRPDKTEHHELWKQCISQEKHATSHRSLVFSAVLVKANQRQSLGREWDTRKAVLLVGLLCQSSRCQRRNIFKSPQEARLRFPERSPTNTLVHSSSTPSWPSLYF